MPGRSPQVHRRVSSLQAEARVLRPPTALRTPYTISAMALRAPYATFSPDTHRLPTSPCAACVCVCVCVCVGRVPRWVRS
eukprot:1475340-Rhodomonas_salina.1